MGLAVIRAMLLSILLTLSILIGTLIVCSPLLVHFGLGLDLSIARMAGCVFVGLIVIVGSSRALIDEWKRLPP